MGFLEAPGNCMFLLGWMLVSAWVWWEVNPVVTSWRILQFMIKLNVIVLSLSV